MEPVRVASGRILYVDEVLTRGVSLRGAAVRVLGQCVRRSGWGVTRTR